MTLYCKILTLDQDARVLEKKAVAALQSGDHSTAFSAHLMAKELREEAQRLRQASAA